MSMSFLYERITKGRPHATGTLAEPSGTPEPRFALQSTVNWMRALALIAEEKDFAWASMGKFYAHVTVNSGLSEPAVNTVFEQLLMSLHHLSALDAMVVAASDRNLARVGIVTWYYGVYCAASAMIAASNGSQQRTHSRTALEWDTRIAARDLAREPFCYRLPSLEKVAAEAEIERLRNGNTFTLDRQPTNPDDARGACFSYLSGTRTYREWEISEDLKKSELRKLGLTNFRSLRAREIRDTRLRAKSLGFLNQAFRYRGKANYRDALFLTYEAQVGTLLRGFLPDLKTVLRAFVSMAGAFCSRRVNTNDWAAFLADLNGHLDVAVMPSDVWS